MEQTAEEFPDDFIAQYGFGAMLAADGDADAALEVFEHAAEVIPEEAEFYLLLGDGFMQVDENERGIEMFRRAVELDPKSTRAHMQLGRALTTDQRFDEALPELERAIKLDARNADAWQGKGLALASLGRHDEAIKALQRALALDPEHLQALVVLTAAYEHSGRHQEAIQVGARAEELAGDDPDALYQIAQLYNGLQQFEAARAVIERVIDLDPEYTEAHMMLAGLAMHLGDTTTAMREVTYVQENDPELLEELAEEYGLPLDEEEEDFQEEDDESGDFDLFPSRRRTAAPKLTVGNAGKPGTIYQLRISLVDFEPEIWRRVLAPSDFTLAKLHDVIQVVMGWDDSHLHDFTIGTEGYTDTRAGLEGRKNEAKVPLHQVAGARGKFTYTYDFGDNWEVEVKVEKVLPREKDRQYPVCLAGEMAGPPDDSGGAWGYAEMLEAVQNPKHPEYHNYQEWLGKKFDPTKFDIDEVKKRLVKIK